MIKGYTAMDLTHAELAILGLLAERPRHGYQIEQVIEERNLREWTEIGFSSIYAALSRLEKAGLVESHLEPSPGRGPGRKVFHLSAQGYAGWQHGMLAALATPIAAPPPLLLGLSALPGLPRPLARQALQDCRRKLLAQRARLAERGAQAAALPHVQAMFTLSLALNQAELDWLEKFLDEMEAGHDNL
jgi:hypothetical protein